MTYCGIACLLCAQSDSESYLIAFAAGSGKRPETWATVVECLRIAELNYLADSVQQQFDQQHTPSSQPTQPPTHAGYLCIPHIDTCMVSWCMVYIGCAL